jgi:predicted TIM-barrel fold metal-dependent hydrolase
MPSCHPDFYEKNWDADRAEREILTAQYWAALGAANSAERRRALDIFGVDMQLVFPSHAPARFDKSYYGSLQESRDPVVLYGGARAYNRAIADFCGADPRMVAVGYVPVEDPARAEEEARAASDLGCRAIMIPTAVPDRTSWTAPEMDRVWSFLDEASMPVVLHISSDVVTMPGFGTRAIVSVRDAAESPVTSLTFPVALHQLMVALLAFDGTFERFPNLRVGVIEYEAGWVPEFLRRLDFMAATGWLANARGVSYRLPLLPSEYVRRQVKFTPEHSEDVAMLVEETGPELYMFSTDWPHDPFPLAPSAFESSTASLDEAARQRFYSQNFAELLGITF